MASLFSISTPPQPQFSKRPVCGSRRWVNGITISTTFVKSPVKFIPLASSSSTPVEDEEKDEPFTPLDGAPIGTGATVADADKLPERGGCKACGREEVEQGCNGEGRIQGGIATVRGFGWWPIKAYRPCPAFVASGGRYRRQGQSMDEVVSGKGEREASSLVVTTNNNTETSKQKEGPRRFKR